MPLAETAPDGCTAARAEAVRALLPPGTTTVRVLGDPAVADALEALAADDGADLAVRRGNDPHDTPDPVVVLALVGPVGRGPALPAALDLLRAGALAPDGTLLVCVDPVLGPDVRADLLAGDATYAETVTVGADGVRRHTTQQLRRLLERHGFVVTGRRRVAVPGAERVPQQNEQSQQTAESETDLERIRGAMPELSDDENTAETVVSATPAGPGGPDGRDEEWQQLFDSRERLRAQVSQLERELETVRSLLVAERAHFQSELRLGAVEVSGMQSEIERHLESRAAIQKQLDKWQREYERLVSVDGKPLAVKVAYRRARRRAVDAVRSDPRLERAARRVLDRVRSR
ncbi:MAG TPA: hypothetical protein VGE77_00090 [Nocardioides sp.]